MSLWEECSEQGGGVVNGVGETDRDQIMQALVGSAKDFVFYSKCSGKSSEHIRQGRVIQLVYHLKKNHSGCCVNQR